MVSWQTWTGERARGDRHSQEDGLGWCCTPAVIPGAAPPTPRLGRGRRIYHKPSTQGRQYETIIFEHLDFSNGPHHVLWLKTSRLLSFSCHLTSIVDLARLGYFQSYSRAQFDAVSRFCNQMAICWFSSRTMRSVVVLRSVRPWKMAYDPQRHWWLTDLTGSATKSVFFGK